MADGGPRHLEPLTEADAELVREQLGRRPRGVTGIAYRCAHGVPAVLQTAPRLPDGTPFPTLYYLTCATLNSIVGRMESDGVMAEMTQRLTEDVELAAAYRTAHETYLATRNALGDLGTQVTAGGMPDRVKCLHVLLAHSLAVGPGVNPLGDETVGLLPRYVGRGETVCVPVAEWWDAPDPEVGAEPVRD